jgi:hypothetical protein
MFVEMLDNLVSPPEIEVRHTSPHYGNQQYSTRTCGPGPAGPDTRQSQTQAELRSAKLPLLICATASTVKFCAQRQANKPFWKIRSPEPRSEIGDGPSLRMHDVRIPQSAFLRRVE